MELETKLADKSLECEILQRNELIFNQKNKKHQKDGWFLYFAVFTVCFSGTGTSTVWPSPVIPMLQSNDTKINPLDYCVTKYDLSLLMLLYSVGNLLAILFSGNIADSIERKNCLLLSTSLNTVAYLMLAFPPNMPWILFATTINGICFGAFITVSPIFISEISADHNRGKFGCLMSMLYPLGQLYCYVLGSVCTYKVLSLACALPLSVTSISLMFLIPETPLHLLHKNKRKAAIKSLEKYRGNLSPQKIEKDIQVIEYTMKHTSEDINGSCLSIFTHQPSRRGFLIGLVMYVAQLSSGIGIMLPFIGPIFNEAKTSISGNMTSMLVGSLKIVLFIFVANIVEKFGRKPFMYISSITCCISLFFLGLYFFMKDKRIGNYQNYSWLPLASIFLYVFGYGIGLGPIPIATIGEMFIGSTRAKALSISTFIYYFINTITSSAFPLITDYIGVWGCMWVFSGCCLVGAMFVHCVMLETKRKSLYEIQQMLIK